MFGRAIPLFKLLGFEVRVDLSWIILAVLITWSLAKGFFPYYYPGFNSATYWWMGGLGALGLFVSIILHELSHSLVARRYGLPMKGITLFIFGGVAEMEDEPPSAKAELLMALAGPMASILISVAAFGVFRVGQQGALWSLPVGGVLHYLGWINGLLAAFNLLPAFPLDGGRVLRSILWSIRKNLRWATRISAGIGAGFGIALITLGVFSVLVGNLIGGVWWFLIGLFLRNASLSSYRQLLVRQAFEGESARGLMSPNAVTVPPGLPVDRLVEDYFYRYHYKMFPVVEDSRLVGCISTQNVKEIPRQEWDRRTVQEIVKECSVDNTIGPDTDATKVLAKMNRTRQSRLMVVDGENLIGVITLKDMLRYLSVKLDLKGEDEDLKQLVNSEEDEGG